MPIPLELLEAFTAGAQEAASFIESILTRGIETPANEVLRQLTEAGLSFNRQSALRLVKLTRFNIRQDALFKTTPLNRIPDLASLRLAKSKIRKNFSFVVRQQGFNPFSGHVEAAEVTVISDELLSLDQIASAGAFLVGAGSKNITLQNAETEVVSGTVSPQYPNGPGIDALNSIEAGEEILA